MKLQVIAALLCIGLTFAAAAINHSAVEGLVQECCDCAEELCQSWSENSPVSTEKLDKLWYSHQPWLESVIHHNLLRDVEDALAEFSAAAEGSDRDGLNSAAASLVSELRHVEEMERLSFGNIL